MIKLKLVGITLLLLVPLTGVSAFAILSLPVTGDLISGPNRTSEAVCPCPPPSDEITIPEDTDGGRTDRDTDNGNENGKDEDGTDDNGTDDDGDDGSDDDSVNDEGDTGDDGTDDDDANDENDTGNDGSDDENDTGDDGSDDENDTGDDGDDDGSDDESDDGDDGCGHSNKCPECGDCIECGSDPCPECCDEKRRCNECIHCTFDIGMVDGKLQYTGTGLLDFQGGVINKGATDEGYWEYTYDPVDGTGAQLDASGLPLRAGQYTVTGKYDNGKYNDSKTSTLTVTPAPVGINVTLENKSKVYDGTTDITGMDAELFGIIGDDIVEISIMGTPSYVSPDAGSNIEVIFSDFIIGGTHAWNYHIVQPDNLSADITRATYGGSISVVIDDDPLRIGAGLTFTASGNPSDYLVQWRVDNEYRDGANDVGYIVKPGDVDKKITVALVSPCRNYEGISPPTDYVPYTVKVLLNDSVVPMENDHVFFGTQDNNTAYAASINNGFVDIDYNLQSSGFGTDSIEYTGGSVSGIPAAGSGKSRYYADPGDAVNGVITLRATAYHRGIAISPLGPFAFKPVGCDNDPTEVYTVTISQLGNAPTGPIYINKSGNYPYEYAISTPFIPGIGIGLSYEMDISVDLSASPPGLSGYTFDASVDITGRHISNLSIPLSIRVDHNFTGLVYRGGFHDHECIGCKYYSRGNCSYSSWTGHSRSCTICRGINSHTPQWTAWTQGTAEQHSRTCTACQLADNVTHAWGSWSSWVNSNATNHTRNRTCTVCSRPGSESVAHSYTAWSVWSDLDSNNHTRNRTCTACSRPGSESAAHTYTAWSAWVNSNSTNHTRSRSCTACSRPGTESSAHSYSAWSAWVNSDSTNHTRSRSCTVCSRPGSETAAHTYTAWSAWVDSGSTNHARNRTCTVCSRPGSESAAHSFTAWTRKDRNTHSRDCSVCSKNDVQNHSWWLTDSFIGTSSEQQRNHNWRCYSCGTFSGNYLCVFNASNICVGGQWRSTTVEPTFDYMEGIGCGIHYTTGRRIAGDGGVTSFTPRPYPFT